MKDMDVITTLNQGTKKVKKNKHAITKEKKIINCLK